eukprot:1169520-Prymnesium_polylepis.1
MRHVPCAMCHAPCAICHAPFAMHRAPCAIRSRVRAEGVARAAVTMARCGGACAAAPHFSRSRLALAR